MKIKAKDGTLSRVPGGLGDKLVRDLKAGKEVEVDKVPHKLISLVDVVQSKPKISKEVK
jgi:hypothetical protein